jgi:GMP synthase-like glutamine amidotransferase
VNVLTLIHGERGEPGTFGEEVAARGHLLEDWSFAWRRPAPRPLEQYDAVLVFGGAMHADQDDHHPWLREEDEFLRNLLEVGRPVLGICLGAQLLAKAAGAPVMPAAEPEIGWVEVALTEEARHDPVFARLPERFHAFQWHYYTYGIPPSAAELARSRICTQALRLADHVWGIQFHAEVTRGQIARWLEHKEPEADVSVEQIATETRQRIADWNRLGRDLCSGFLDVAERLKGR